jgi:exodeoxyribonuclease V alpha subunit
MNRGGRRRSIAQRRIAKAALNPAGERKVERFGWTFSPGDEVMQIANDYERRSTTATSVYVKDVKPDDAELSATLDERLVTYSFGELDTLVPAYAATIDKSKARNTRLW